MKKALVILIALILAGFVGYYVYTSLRGMQPAIESHSNPNADRTASSSPLLKTDQTGSLILP